MIYSDRPAGPPQQAYGDNRIPGAGYIYPDEDNRGLRPPGGVGAPGNVTGSVQQQSPGAQSPGAQPPQGPDGRPMVLSALPPEEQPEAGAGQSAASICAGRKSPSSPRSRRER